MNLMVITYFLTICQTHSFSKAAEALYITPQGISKSIKRLEAEIGCPLFERNSDNLSLTPSGEIFKNHAEKIAAELKALNADLSAVKKEEVILGATMGTYQILNLPVLNVIQKICPHILINYVESWDTQCEENILDHVFDLALTSGPVNQQKFNSDVLYRSPVSVLVKEGHPLYDNTFLTVRELKPYPLLLVSSHFRLYYNFMESCRLSGFKPVIYDTAVMVESMFHCCPDHSAAGIVIDAFIEHRDMEHMRIIPLSGKDICWELTLVSAKDSIPSPSVLQIRDAILSLPFKHPFGPPT